MVRSTAGLVKDYDFQRLNGKSDLKDREDLMEAAQI